MSLNIDRSSWKRVVFGDVVANINDYFNPDVDGVLPYVAGPHINAGQPTVADYGSTDDDQFPPTFKRKFRAGDVLLHSRGIEKLASVSRLGVTGEKLFVLRSKDEATLLQAFLVWLLHSQAARAHMQEHFTGSVNKFLNWTPLAAMEVDLPPIDEQKRIADLLWAVERHGLAMNGERDAARVTLGRFALHRLSTMSTTIRLGDVATTRSGPSFAASDVHDSPVKGSVPVLGIPNTKPDGTIDLTRVGHVTHLSKSLGKIDESSLVLIRTNGNRQRIGNVYLPPAEAEGHAVSAFQFLMKSNDPADREYLYWVLSEPTMQERISEAASGTVGLGNLAVRWLNEQQIPWSTDAAKLQVMVDEMRNLASAVALIDLERAALVALRCSLSADVFGGN